MIRRFVVTALLAAAAGGLAALVLPRALAHALPAVAWLVAAGAGVLMVALRYGLIGAHEDDGTSWAEEYTDLQHRETAP
jgi:hypothetical protein